VPAAPTELEVSLGLSISLADAEHLSAHLVAERGSLSADALRETLWLRAVLLEQWRRTPIVERHRFARRADRVLEQFWAGMKPVCPSEVMNTVECDDKP
jgi:quinol monooxygenase YgiN